MKKLLMFMALFTIGLAGCSGNASIEFDDTSLTADNKGSYEVIGTQEPDAVVSFDGEVVDLFPDEDGKFELTLYPEDPKDEVIVTSVYKDKTTEVTLKIDNAKYTAYQKQQAEEKKKVEAAKKKAEEEHKLAVQKATDEAKTKIEEAEKELNRDSLSSAKASVAKIPDGNEELSNRLVVIEEKITENERIEEEKKEQERIAAEKAEQERIAAEEARVQAEQAEAARVAEENRLAEEAANQQVDGDVYVTRTGKRYHAYAHGNGDFWLDSLSAAQSRGLTPCQVCW